MDKTDKDYIEYLINKDTHGNLKDSYVDLNECSSGHIEYKDEPNHTLDMMLKAEPDICIHRLGGTPKRLIGMEMDGTLTEKRKYKLTDETIQHKGRMLHRIQATMDFGNIRKGDKGGFVESYDNLESHPSSSAWVHNFAMLYDKARVKDGAHVLKNSQAYGNALIEGFSVINGQVKIYGDVRVYNSSLCGDFSVCGDMSLECEGINIEDGNRFSNKEKLDAYIDEIEREDSITYFNGLKLELLKDGKIEITGINGKGVSLNWKHHAWIPPRNNVEAIKICP